MVTFKSKCPKCGIFTELSYPHLKRITSEVREMANKTVCFPCSAQADTQLPAEVTPGPLKDPEEVCGDCPPIGYPTDKTRCAPCPRRVTPEPETPFDNERADMKYREDMKDAGRGHLLR